MGKLKQHLYKNKTNKMNVFELVLIFCSATFADRNELFLSTPEILQHRNIPYENHTVITEDGYILTIFRLPKTDRRGVILLHHSSSLDSSVFLLSKKRSIAVDILNAGYEVWLPNFRGLPFSTGHIKPTINKEKYWDFSYHEIGYYDYPAIINYVTNITGSKVFVINHSLSSTAALVYSSLRPKEAESHIKLFVNMASSAFMNHTKSPLKYLIPIEFEIVKPLLEMLDIRAAFHDFMPYIRIIKQIVLEYPIQTILEKSLELFFGPGSEMDSEEFPMIISVITQPFSGKIFYHYSQNVLSGKFCMYDYGKDENRRRYNSSEPPNYPLKLITAPIFLVISDTDFMSDEWGSNKLYQELPSVSKRYGKMYVHHISHGAYLIGKDRFIVFDKILEVINSIN